MGVVLFILARAVEWIFSPFLYWYGVIYALIVGEWDVWHKELAIAKDQYGNVLGKYFWNTIFLSADSLNKFGNPDIKISTVLAVNYYDGTLSSIGLFLAKILEALDPGHLKTAMETDKDDLINNN